MYDCIAAVVAAAKLYLDFYKDTGPLFITWLVQLLFPFMLVTLVYEKERGCDPLLRRSHRATA